jgi:hypothetical protein
MPVKAQCNLRQPRSSARSNSNPTPRTQSIQSDQSKKAELWARIGKVISETKGDADDDVALPLLGRMRSPTKRVACQGGEGKKGRRGWRRCPNRRSHVEDQVVERGRAGGSAGERAAVAAVAAIPRPVTPRFFTKFDA